MFTECSHALKLLGVDGTAYFERPYIDYLSLFCYITKLFK